MLYRILTENKNRQVVEDIVSAEFPGFTIIEAMGYWNGVRELSLIIEIDAGNEFKGMAVTRIAEMIKRHNQQESIMIQAVMTHADRMTTILTAPAGASPAEVEMAVKWVAEALYQVGALAIRSARLAAGRTQTAETLPGV